MKYFPGSLRKALTCRREDASIESSPGTKGEHYGI